MDDFETCINFIDDDYDSEDIIFTGWLYKVNKPEFNKINRSQYGRGKDFEQEIFEYTGNYCYIPTSGICFIKCIIHIIGKNYTKNSSL